MDSAYNAELTFAPKLNEASLRLAEKAAQKWKNRAPEIRRSREKALVAEANAAFTFHPAMNSKSQKIVSRIRKYEEGNYKRPNVQLSYEQTEYSSDALLSSDESMNLSSREPSFETASVHVAQEAENFIQEVISSCKGEISSDEEDDSEKQQDVSSTPEEPPKPPPRKMLNIPRTLPYNNADYLYKIRVAKETALDAIRLKRIFTILGPYPYLRKALIKRGWVEKFSEHSCQPVLGSPQAIRPRPAKKKKKVAVKKKITEASNSSDSENSSSENEENDLRNDPEFHRIVSRLLKDISPTFIWTIKRDDIDFKYLNREQIVNHYCKASSFTTKIGLCQHLRSLPWFDASDPNEFFPRCYQLYNEEDRGDFIEDFEICASLSILKVYCKQYKEQLVKEDKVAPDQVESDKDGISVVDAANFVPVSAISLAANHLKFVIRRVEDEFLDFPPDPKDEMSHFKRKQILGFSYSLTAKEFTFESFDESTHKLASGMLEVFTGLNLTQNRIDGHTNTWIMKPGAKSRGRGVVPQNNLDEIIKLADSSKEEKWVIQKYIEHPLLVHGIKFDIRQWFMVTDWNPLTLYFYQDCYLRFGSRAFTLDDFDPCIHLCNNSIQKKFLSAQSKNETTFAQGNMWTSNAFKKYLQKQGLLQKWDDVIYPGMKKSIQMVMMTIQDIIEDRKNSFELYGADFMLDEEYNPWLIEINCSPAMGGTTKVTERLCSEVLDDCCKVIIDKRENRSAPTGKWEIIYKQPLVTVPPYIGVQLALEGKYLAKPTPIRKKLHAEIDLDRLMTKKAKSPRHPKSEATITPRKCEPQKQELKSSKIVGITVAGETHCNMNLKSLVCKHTKKYEKELYTTLSLKGPRSSSEPPLKKSSSVPTTIPASPNKQLESSSSNTALPSIPTIIATQERSASHLSSLSISPISSIQGDDRWTLKKSQKHSIGRVSELIPTQINPYRLQQIISRQSKPKHLNMLALQNRYTHAVQSTASSVAVLDVKPKRRNKMTKMKKVSKIKSLSKLSNCPHCETKTQTGIILNLLKSGSPNACKPSHSNKKPEHISQNQRPKKHFRVSLSQVSTMSQNVVDIQQNGSSLKIVGEQTSN